MFSGVSPKILRWRRRDKGVSAIIPDVGSCGYLREGCVWVCTGGVMAMSLVKIPLQ